MRLRPALLLLLLGAASSALADAPVRPADGTLLWPGAADSSDTELGVTRSLVERLVSAHAASDLPGTGVRLNLGDGRSVDASLLLEPASNLSLLCGDRALAGSFGPLADLCLQAQLAPRDPLIAAGTGAGLGLAWTTQQYGVDLSFGLSWLASRELDVRQPGAVHALPPDPGVGGMLPGWRLDLEQFGVSAQASAPFRRDGRLLLDARALDGRADLGTGIPLRWESAAITLGLQVGRWTAALTGHSLSIPGLRGRSSDLDIGVSWRTPWRGELTVGARNVLGTAKSPLDSISLLPEGPALDDASPRTPFVRYHQDL